MAKTLMESIAEDEKTLGTLEPETPEGEEDGNQPEQPTGLQPKDERDSAASAESGREGTEGNGRRGRGKRASGRSSGDASQNESGASREDGEASPRDSAGTRKDAGAPPENAEGSGRDDGRGRDAVEDKAPADHAAWAKLRREKRELEAKLKAAEGKPALTAPTAPVAAAKVETKAATDAEPDKAANPEAWRDWKERQRDNEIAELRAYRESQVQQAQHAQVFREAIGEFNQIRDEYISKNPDYIPAFTHGYDAYARSIKMLNPSLTQSQITGLIDKELLKFAGEAVSKGLNPAEELYDMAIERFGYTPNSAKAANEDTNEEEAEPENKAPVGIRPKETPRPNLRAIANNRKRSASPLVGAGQGGKGQLTKEGAANMTLGEMMELEPADWAELERHGGA